MGNEVDPEGLPAFFEKTLQQHTAQPTPLEAFFSTHPTDEARIVRVRTQIARLGTMPVGLVRDTPEFHAAQVRLRGLGAADEVAAP